MPRYIVEQSCGWLRDSLHHSPCRWQVSLRGRWDRRWTVVYLRRIITGRKRNNPQSKFSLPKGLIPYGGARWEARQALTPAEYRLRRVWRYRRLDTCTQQRQLPQVCGWLTAPSWLSAGCDVGSTRLASTLTMSRCMPICFPKNNTPAPAISVNPCLGLYGTTIPLPA